MTRPAWVLIFALLCAVLVLPQRAAASHHFISITNNTGSTITSIYVAFQTANGPVTTHDKRSIARHAVIKYVLPHAVAVSGGTKTDVSSTCLIDVEFVLADGTSYWLRGKDLCSSPYIDARSSSAYSYAHYDYATPIPFTPEPSATPSPSPTPQTPAEQEVTRGAELFARGHFADAMLFFNRAVKLDPSDTFALAYRGRTLFMMDQFDKSLSDLDRGLQLDSKAGLLYWLRGLTLWGMGVYGSAATDFQSALENGAPREYLTILEALADRDDGRAAEAHALLVACKRTCAHSTTLSPFAIHYMLGELSASALLSKAKTNFNESDAHAIIGLTLLQHGDAAGAKPHFLWVLHNAKPVDNWPPIIRRHMKGPK